MHSDYMPDAPYKNMERRVYSQLLAWKDSEDRRPLILDGVRQCGKTYILKEFGRNEYDSVAYLNLERQSDLCAIFGDDLDPRRIITDMGIALHKRIVPGRTLIIIDEIQSCPRALTALKYLNEEAPEYHVACAGSLLGILTSRPDSFPVGQVDRIRMYPLSFYEFLDANGERDLREMLESLGPGEGVGDAFRDGLERYLRQYLVVGGMPAAVQSWTEHHNEAAVTRILRGILRDYMDDFAKHASKDLQKLTWIWDSIPAQLARENNRFSYGDVCDNGRASTLSDALEWLVNAGLVHRVSRVKAPSRPLSSNRDQSDFKIYLCDVGLLRVMAGRRGTFLKESDQEGRLFRGAMAENHVLCQMLAGGLESAFYWREGNHEVDFLIDGDDGPVPVEVKSERARRSASLSRYMEERSPGTAFMVSMTGEGKGGATGVTLFCAENIPRYISGEAEAPVVEHAARPYTEAFSASDWIESGGEWSLTIPRRRHGIAKPSVIQTYKHIEGGYSMVALGVTVSDGGDVTLWSSLPFEGLVSVMRSGAATALRVNRHILRPGPEELGDLLGPAPSHRRDAGQERLGAVYRRQDRIRVEPGQVPHHPHLYPEMLRKGLAALPRTLQDRPVQQVVSHARPAVVHGGGTDPFERVRVTEHAEVAGVPVLVGYDIVQGQQAVHERRDIDAVVLAASGIIVVPVDAGIVDLGAHHLVRGDQLRPCGHEVPAYAARRTVDVHDIVFDGR